MVGESFEAEGELRGIRRAGQRRVALKTLQKARRIFHKHEKGSGRPDPSGGAEDPPLGCRWSPASRHHGSDLAPEKMQGFPTMMFASF